jgi:hypothetical protein
VIAMILEVAPDRTKCRRCGTKLTRPTSNQRSAFCCKGCFRIFYGKRCLACEEPKENPSKALCGRRNCTREFNALKRHGMLGWYYQARGVQSAFANPIKIGVRIIGPDDVPINLIGGYRWPGAKIELLPPSLRKLGAHHEQAPR